MQPMEKLLTPDELRTIYPKIKVIREFAEHSQRLRERFDKHYLLCINFDTMPSQNGK